MISKKIIYSDKTTVCQPFKFIVCLKRVYALGTLCHVLISFIDRNQFGIQIRSISLPQQNVVLPTCKLQCQISRTTSPFRTMNKSNHIQWVALSREMLKQYACVTLRARQKQRKTFVLFSMAFMMWKRHPKYYIANDNGEILLQIHFRYLFGMVYIVVCVFAKNEPIISID